MEQRVKNLQDRFTIDDLEISTRVRNSYNSGYSRIALVSEDVKDDVIHTCLNVLGEDITYHSNVEFFSLKFYYAIQVFQRAVQISYGQKRFKPYWSIQWGGQQPFYELFQYGYTKNNAVENSIAAFWNLLQKTAESGDIKVYEHYWISTKKNEQLDNHISKHCAEYHVVLRDPHDFHHSDGDIFKYPYDATPVSFTWEEIKHFFVELTLTQLSLTMPYLMHEHSPEDELLFTSCRNHDIDGIRYALSKGANAIALNNQGESALQLVIEFNSDIKAAIQAIDILLDAGADIDLFGIGGIQPITAAFYEENVDVVKYLLEKGSNPNYNSFLTEDFIGEYERNVSSSILDIMHTREVIDLEEDMITPEMRQIKDLVLQYGGKLFRDDAVLADEEHENINK